ncbi:MAG: FG-GAP repeat protein, partial [Anaerolineales bacterium]|nr:FG-GAP repeat protein [Anaerolineales bacterium]
MKIKLVRLFVSIFLGISMIGALLGMFQILPTMAQAQDCNGAILEACNDLDPQEVESETAVLAWLHADDETINPEQALADAYQRTLDAGSYEFTADSEQLLLPRPLPSMIGQTSQRVDMHVNGEVTLPDYSMLSVSLDGAGLNPAPVAIIQEGTNSYLLREGEKVPVENPAGLTSPTGDYLSYLAAAENVQACESDAAPFATAVACYTYQINGLKYAEHVRQQMQAQLSQTPGATSIGVEYEVSPILKQISGQGKIWLDANGLPLRQKIDMLMPEADERYDADIRLVIDYRFDEEAVASALAAASPFASFIPPVEEIVQTAGEALPNLAIFSFFMVITALLALLYRRRWIYGFIAILLTISYLATPLLQVININLFYVRQVHAAAEAATFSNTFVAPVAEESASAPVATQSLLTQSLTASAQAFEPDVYCGKGGNADRDGDGLADDAENCLGTNPNLADSDGDAINDGVEVAGFEFGQTISQTWHSNPLDSDTNGDGVNDGIEWAQSGGGAAQNWDIDEDGIPNLYDVDDDGDGVADSRDLSPASYTEYLSYTNTTPTPPPFFSFPFLSFPIIIQEETPTETVGINITGQYNGYVYVDLQVQPQDQDHLRYGLTPLDWGYDTKGQIQEHNEAPDEDIRLVPMLVVETNLVPDTDLAEGYNVTSYQDTDEDGYREMMMPLFGVGEEGNLEAFHAHMAYGPGTLNTLGEDGVHWRNARIVWLVRGTFDVANDDGTLAQQAVSLHTYEEAATRITGFEVTKSGSFQSAIIGTPSMPNDDRALFQMAFGLSGSFLANKQLNLDEINARFSGANTPIEQKWGITTTMAIDLPALEYAHVEEGMADLNNRIKTFLSDHYAWDTPNTVLIAYELNSGSTNLDDLGQMETSFAANVNLYNVSMRTQRSIHLNMRDGWEPLSGGELSLAVMKRVQPAATTAVNNLSDQYPAVTETELVALTQAMYATWESGRTSILSIDGIDFSSGSSSDQALYEQIYLTPRDRYNDPENINTLPGYLVEVGNFAQKGGGLLLNGAQGGQYLQANASEAANLGITMATVQFVQKADNALKIGLGGSPTFGDSVDWKTFEEEVGNAWYDTDDYNNSKQSVTDGLNAFSILGGATEGASKLAKAGTKIASVLTKAAKFLDVAGKVVGVAALAIDIGLSVTTFILNGDFSGEAIALLIAQIIVAVMLFALSLIPPWIGTVISVLLAIFDLVLSFCEACRNFLGFSSVSGWFSKNLASYFYREQPLTELQTYNYLERDTALADEELGYTVGNRFIISDTFNGVMKVSGTKGIDFSAVKNGAIMGGGYGAVLALSDQIDLVGTIFGGPSKRENLQNSWICGQFVIKNNLNYTGTTCPDKSADYNLDNIPSSANYWNYSNQMQATVTLNKAEHDFAIWLSTKVVAQSRWDASTPIPPVLFGVSPGRIHWTKERILNLPDDLSSDDQDKWELTPIYIDVLPGTVEELWNWGRYEYIMTNHDPDGDGMTTKDEITAWLGSSGYSEMNTFFSSVLNNAYGNNSSSDLDRFLANWDLLESSSLFQIPAFCTTYPSLAGLCDANSSPPWLTVDFDGDGLSDKFEYMNNGTLGTNGYVYDTDGDGLSDGFEHQIGTRIDEKDSDADGLQDNVEVYHPLSNGTWDGGWDIDLPAYGAVGPNGRSTITVRVFSDPLKADTDGDGLSDFAEKENGTSPTGFNRAPRVYLSGQPTAVSPQGISAVYVKPGDPITLNTRLEVYPPYIVTSTMNLDLPGNAFGFPTTTDLNGSRWVPNQGVTFNPRWGFNNNALQPWEYLYATTTSGTASPSSSVVTTATLTLPFGGENQSQEATQRIVVDVENPRFGWMTPIEGELIGGGLTHYVVGGTSSDATTWVNELTLNMPGETIAVTDTESFSPWAYTWELPADGIYTLSGSASDFVGHTSAQDSVEVMIDNSAPTVDVDLEDGAVYGPPQDSSVITITMNGTASENLSGLTRVQISTDGGPWREVWTLSTATVTNTTFTDFTSNFANRATAATWNAVWTLPNVETVQGYHNLRVRAFDQAGNWPVYLDRNIIIDVLPPTDELVNRAYIYEYPHVPANEPHTFEGVANDVGNVPQPSRPVELVGDVDGMEDATIMLGLSNIHENDAGVNVAWIGDFNGDRRGDLLVGLPASADGAGRVAVVYGRSGDWPVPDEQEMLAEAKSSFIGVDGAAVGAQVMPAGDVNGDGLADILIGDPANNRVFLIFGKNTYFGTDVQLDGPQGSNWTVLVPPQGQTIGQYLGAAGDVNGDGYADLLIGATGSADMAYLIMGQTNEWWPSLPINTIAAARIDQAGSAMLNGVGDLDGDFYDEFAVGTNSQLYLFEGKSSFTPRAGTWLTLSSAAESFSSSDLNPEAVGLGDVDGDNIDDFIYSNGSSQVLAFGDDDLLDGSWSTYTYNYGSGFLAAPGDVDNDGLNDILIGNGSDAYLISGSNIGAAQSTISGVADAASAPYAAGADLNSDGSSDLLLVPAAAGSQAAATTAGNSIADLPPTWVPQLPEQTLDTFTGSNTWPSVSGNAYVSGNGDCHGMFPCYSTIQAAVDSLGGYDLIIVQPGVYAPFSIDGNQTFHDYLQIRGTDTDAVIIDGGGSSYAILVSNVDAVKLENMTIRNASYGVQLDNAGINGHEETFRRIILDRLLIYDTSSYDIYMSRNSTASVRNSTLSRSSNHVGTYGPADSNIVVEWSNVDGATTPWPITDGGGAVRVNNMIFVNRGGGSNEMGRFFINGEYWSDPWGPQNAYEANSVIAAGSDDQVYLLGAPHWKDASNTYSWRAQFAAAADGNTYKTGAVSGEAMWWNGNAWETVPGSPSQCRLIATHPVNSDLYCLDYSGDSLYKWDGSSWTTVTEDPLPGSGLSLRDMEVDTNGVVHVVGSFSFNSGLGDPCFNYATFSSVSWSCYNSFESGDTVSTIALDGTTPIIGGEFSNEYYQNIASGMLPGVSGPVNDIEIGEDGSIYVAGSFTSTLTYGGDIDQAVPAGLAVWRNSSWTVFPEITPAYGEGTDYWTGGAEAYSIAETAGGELYVTGSWYSFPVDGGDTVKEQFMHWNGTAWERAGLVGNAANNEGIEQVIDSPSGIFVSGDYEWMVLPDDSTLTTQHITLIEFSHEVYSPTTNAWINNNFIGAPMSLGDGASYAGDDFGNLVLLVGGGRTDSFKYDIATGLWSRVTGMNDPVNASAMTKGEDGYVYAVTDGPSSLYRFTGYSWEAVGPTISGASIDDGVTMAYDSHFGTYYVLPGGNGTMMLRYNPAWGSSWVTLPVDRNTPAGIRPGAGLVFVEGEDENKLYTAQGNYIGDTSTAFWMYPLPMPNKIDFTDSIIYAQNGTNWLNLSDPLPEDFNFRVDENSRFFGGTGWTPTNLGSLPTTTDDPFLDADRDIYRLSETGATYTIGYHIYTEPVTATTATGIQAMINTGANRVIVEPGIYEEDIYLVNGVEVIGTNPDWTVIKPLNGSTADALVRAMGSNGASFSRFTLDGENSGVDGFAATGNAANLTLQRARIFDTETGIALDGSDSDVEVAHVTVANNVNGLVATNCASIDVRNSIFAYQSGVGLSHEACAAVQLHTYNLYWANASDFGADADAGAAELFLDPNFVDPMDHDYRTLNFSPVIDAGNPTDPSPPGAGSRADIGYIEQGRVSFYVDDSYCDICINDGLTWQVDAFDNIQDALDAAENALSNLNPNYAAVPQLVVGVAPGTYNEQVTIPSHVLLFGSGPEETIIDAGGSGTAVTFNGVSEAGLRHFTVMNADLGILVGGASNLIDVQRNIIRNNVVGLTVNGRATGQLQYNTLVSNQTGVLANEPGSWVAMMHNIVSGSTTGLMASNNGQIFTDYNLLYNTLNLSGVEVGENDILDVDPLFAGGGTPYRLSENSPALDAASPQATVPQGGGTVADLGYSELLAAPVTLLLGQEDLSTVMGNSGVASVEYGVASVADPTSLVTTTLPTAWLTVTLDSPGETFSYWSLDYTPIDEGLYRFYTRATDMVGNSEEEELEWYDGSFVVDSTPPTVDWLAPTDGASLAAPLELRAQVTDYAAGEFSVDENDVYFEVDGQRYPATWAAEPWDESAGEPRVFRAWISPTLGTYTNVVAGAEDKAGNSTVNSNMNFTLTAVSPEDTTPPTVTVSLPLPNSWVTHTVVFSGTASDVGSGIASVELSLDGGATWRPTTVSGEDWSLTWEGPEELPMISFPAQVRATDKSGFATVTAFQFSIDEVAPTGLIPVTFSAPEESHFDVITDLEINWQPPIDASGVVTTFLVVDQITDTIPGPANVVSGLTAVHSLNSNGDWYAHLSAMDEAGNANMYHF